MISFTQELYTCFLSLSRTITQVAVCYNVLLLALPPPFILNVTVYVFSSGLTIAGVSSTFSP